MSSIIAGNVVAVQAEIAAACARSRRAASDVRLIAVTKSQGPEVLAALAAAGVCDFGENRVEHLAAMHEAAPPAARFHAIGRIQSRQIARVVALAACLHSLCDHDHLAELSRRLEQGARRMQVFVQVNTSGEASKAGLAPADLARFVDEVRAAPAVDLVGLMTMAPMVDDAARGADGDAVRRCFAELRALSEIHRLPRLSMGMSQDFIIAVEEGATDVRVGTRLFA
ncbi:MAG: YggS family pyridoxal phosphate-dependent enzyme [Planctomycetes bacterium]|nr:YggS family pyridoxal phosphate-dependent enzyme [Planctomycetota bacterium]